MAARKTGASSATDPAEARKAGQPDTTATDSDNDTEGQMMIPDGTSRLLARDRERDIRKHLSDREMERQARDARPHRK
jgi:hypothetical protein